MRVVARRALTVVNVSIFLDTYINTRDAIAKISFDTSEPEFLIIYLEGSRNISIIYKLETFSHKFARLNNSHIQILVVKNNFWSCRKRRVLCN